MQTLLSHKEFIFFNDAGQINAVLEQVLNAAKELVGTNKYSIELEFKAKFIVTEFLTNAIKHSGASQVTLSIGVNNNQLIIAKKDAGLRYNPMPEASIVGTKKQISFDVMHRLFAVLEADSSVSFFAEESDDDYPDVNEITEHYGLLIITKCARHFTFRFDDEHNLNYFTAVIDLQKI